MHGKFWSDQLYLADMAKKLTATQLRSIILSESRKVREEKREGISENGVIKIRLGDLKKIIKEETEKLFSDSEK